MKQVLLITPYFPPSVDIGAKRALNLVRHLRSFGWEPLVLASACNSTFRDADLEKLLPENLYIFRMFGPTDRKCNPVNFREIKAAYPLFKKLDEKGSYLTPFDQYIWYVPRAVAAGKQILNRHNIHAILVNADPWSGLIVANYLAKYASIPWIADLRDPWSIHTFKMSLRPAITRYLIGKFESAFFHSAAKVILNTETCCQTYRDKYRKTLDGDRFTFIRNAFDPLIYTTAEFSQDTDKFSLHYFGSFRSYLDPDPLFNLIKQFITKHGHNPENMELVLYGKQREQDIKLAGRYGLDDYIRYQESVKLQEMLLHLKSASVLLLVEGPHRRLQLPAKLYDYLAAKRPILAMSNNPELDTIIEKTGSGISANILDPEDCLRQLEYLYFNRVESWQFSDTRINEYRVESQIKRFSDVLNEIT